MAIVEHKCEKDGPGKVYQEKLYGKNKVVANPKKDGTFVCSICGKIVSGVKVENANAKKRKEKKEA